MNTGCKIAGCTGAHEARGWCRIHYMRWLRTGDPLALRSNRKYPWPLIIGASTYIPAPDRKVRCAVQQAASKFGNRVRWVLRTRWDGQSVRVVRAA